MCCLSRLVVTLWVPRTRQSGDEAMSTTEERMEALEKKVNAQRPFFNPENKCIARKQYLDIQSGFMSFIFKQ